MTWRHYTPAGSEIVISHGIPVPEAAPGIDDDDCDDTGTNDDDFNDTGIDCDDCNGDAIQIGGLDSPLEL